METDPAWYTQPVLLLLAGIFLLLVGSMAVVDNLKRFQPRSVDDTIELDKNCPNCGTPLRGRKLEEFVYDQTRPLRAWRVCFPCGFKERAPVTVPWTKTQGDESRREDRLDRERERVLEYLRIKDQFSATTFTALMMLSPTEFEEAVAEILEANGYKDAFTCGGPGDLGVDITCTSATGESVAVQCKRYDEKPVGSREMQSFIGMVHTHHNVDKGIYVTTSRFTKPAQALAEEHGILLVEQEELTRMLAAVAPPPQADESVRKLEAWDLVQDELDAQARELARKQKRERIERARRWG